MKWIVNPIGSGSATPQWCPINECDVFHGFCLVNLCYTKCPTDLVEPCPNLHH